MPEFVKETDSKDSIDRLANYALAVVGAVVPGESPKPFDLELARRAVQIRGDIGLAIEDLRSHFAFRFQCRSCREHAMADKAWFERFPERR